MLLNPIEQAPPLTIHRLRNLLSDYEACLIQQHDHPRDVSRIGKAIKAEFLKDFCSLFGKTATVTDEDRGYLTLSVVPQRFDTELAKWLSRTQIIMPVEGQSVEPTDHRCRIQCGEIKQLMKLVKHNIEQTYD